MTFTTRMLLQNAGWADEAAQRDPQLFNRLAQGQSPKILWIGCSDSRVPAETVTSSHPGDLFVHRNIANLFSPHDDSAMSVLEYAVLVLKVRDIVVCGHYACGGVQASLSAANAALPHVERRIRPLRELARKHREHLNSFSELGARANRLAELSVTEQVRTLRATDVVRDASPKVAVHGWIFGVRDGLIRVLDSESSASPALDIAA